MGPVDARMGDSQSRPNFLLHNGETPRNLTEPGRSLLVGCLHRVLQVNAGLWCGESKLFNPDLVNP